MNNLSIRINRLLDLYKINYIDFWNDESAMSYINKLVEERVNKKISEYKKLICKV